MKTIAMLLATALGSGFSPKAPGTAGTLVALILAYFIRDWSFFSFSALWLLLFLSGWWAAWAWSRHTQLKDPQTVVIDEVLGYLIAVSVLPHSIPVLLIQFVLFRFFDVLKPFPIRQLDQWGKKFPIGPIQSLGIILDDCLAGLMALFTFVFLRFLATYFGLVL